jgi:hypothetical protein
MHAAARCPGLHHAHEQKHVLAAHRASVKARRAPPSNTSSSLVKRGGQVLMSTSMLRRQVGATNVEVAAVESRAETGLVVCCGAAAVGGTTARMASSHAWPARCTQLRIACMVRCLLTVSVLVCGTQAGPAGQHLTACTWLPPHSPLRWHQSYQSAAGATAPHHPS